MSIEGDALARTLANNVAFSIASLITVATLPTMSVSERPAIASWYSAEVIEPCLNISLSSSCWSSNVDCELISFSTAEFIILNGFVMSKPPVRNDRTCIVFSIAGITKSLRTFFIPLITRINPTTPTAAAASPARRAPAAAVRDAVATVASLALVNKPAKPFPALFNPPKMLLPILEKEVPI